MEGEPLTANFAMHLHSDGFAHWRRAFGSNLDRWPAALQLYAVQHLASSAKSRATLQRARQRAKPPPISLARSPR